MKRPAIVLVAATALLVSACSLGDEPDEALTGPGIVYPADGTAACVSMYNGDPNLEAEIFNALAGGQDTFGDAELVAVDEVNLRLLGAVEVATTAMQAELEEMRAPFIEIVEAMREGADSFEVDTAMVRPAVLEFASLCRDAGYDVPETSIGGDSR